MASQETGTEKKTDFLTPALAIGGGLLGLFVFAHIAALGILGGLVSFLGTAVMALGGAALGVVGGARAATAIKHGSENKGSSSQSPFPKFLHAQEKEASLESGTARGIMPDVGKAIGSGGMIHHAITGLSNSAFAQSIRERLGRSHTPPAQEVAAQSSREI